MSYVIVVVQLLPEANVEVVGSWDEYRDADKWRKEWLPTGRVTWVEPSGDAEAYLSRRA